MAQHLSRNPKAKGCALVNSAPDSPNARDLGRPGTRFRRLHSASSLGDDESIRPHSWDDWSLPKGQKSAPHPCPSPRELSIDSERGEGRASDLSSAAIKRPLRASVVRGAFILLTPGQEGGLIGMVVMSQRPLAADNKPGAGAGAKAAGETLL